MKYFLLVIASIIAVLAALMFVPVQDGKPLLSPERVKATIEQTGIQMDTATDNGGWLDETSLNQWYRWKDSHGNWQYGDRPPPGVVAEPIEKKSIKTVSAGQPLESSDAASQDSQ